MDEREMYEEISALMGMVGKAFDITDMEVLAAIEQGRLGLEMKVDGEGLHYVEAVCDGKSAHIYPGAIFRPDDHGGDHGGGCGGGCSCGR